MWPAFRVRVVVVCAGPDGSAPEPFDLKLTKISDLSSFFSEVQLRLSRLDVRPVRLLVPGHLVGPVMILVTAFKFTTLAPVCFKSELIPTEQTNVSLSRVLRG